MMLRLRKRFAADRSGSTAIEFALIAGPLMLLLLGTLEFGRVEWARQALHETAIQGARCIGVLRSDCAASGAYSASKAKTYIAAVASGWGLTLPASNITINNSVTCEGVSGFSRVQLTYNFDSVVAGAIDALVQNLPLTADACFPNQPS